MSNRNLRKPHQPSALTEFVGGAVGILTLCMFVGWLIMLGAALIGYATLGFFPATGLAFILWCIRQVLL